MDGIKNFFAELPDNFNDFCDRYFLRILICVLVVLLFLLLKFILSAVIKRIIRSTNARHKNGSNERMEAVNSIFLPPVRILLVTLALFTCAAVLSPPANVYALLMRVVKSLFIISLFSVLYGLSGYAKFIISRSYKWRGESPYNLAVEYTGKLLKIGVILLGALTVLQQWVTDITGLVAGLSIGGVALALAAQDTASNMFGSLTVMFDHPFEIGDYIEVGSVVGTVEQMGMRSTKIRCSNQTLVFVPNSKMSSECIVNWSMLKKRRVDQTVGILYSTPAGQLEQFMTSLHELISSDEEVEGDTVIVTFADYAESSLNITFCYYPITEKYSEMCRIKSKINLKILRLANDTGIVFAYPTRSVYIESAPDGGGGDEA